MLVGGIVLLTLGIVIAAFEDLNRGGALAVLGLLLFLPGSYAATLLFGTYMRWPGYKYSQVKSRHIVFRVVVRITNLGALFSPGCSHRRSLTYCLEVRCLCMHGAQFAYNRSPAPSPPHTHTAMPLDGQVPSYDD